MASRDCYDVVILGVGPAGLQAAVHAGRRKASVLLLGSARKSSLFTAHIENYFSLFNISGEEMLKRGTEQARQFGAEILEESVISIAPGEDIFKVTTEGGKAVAAKSIIFATGSKRNTLGVRGGEGLFRTRCQLLRGLRWPFLSGPGCLCGGQRERGRRRRADPDENRRIGAPGL